MAKKYIFLLAATLMGCCEIESAVLFLHGRRPLTWLAPRKEAWPAQECASEIMADCRRSSTKADEARNEWSCHRSPCETWGGIVEAAEEVQANGTMIQASAVVEQGSATLVAGTV